MGNIKKVFVTRSDAVSDLMVEKWFDSIKDCEYTSVLRIVNIPQCLQNVCLLG